MKIIIFLVVLLASFNACAWYCLEVASERVGDVVNACGIGEAADEDAARKVALNNAYKELDLICSRSADCADRALEITPMRTDCQKVDNLYRCHRGVTAKITTAARDLSQKQLLEEVFIPKKIIQADGTGFFKKSSIIDFSSNPLGARVHIDGVEICQTPCTKEIDQGEHKVTYEKEDYELLSEVVQIKEGRQTFNPSLQMRYGYVTIIDLPVDAVVKVNNKEISAKERIRLSPNEHVLTITSAYFQPWFKQFSLKKGDILEFKYDAEALVGHVKISASDDKGNPLEASISINGKTLSQKTPTAIAVNSGKNIVTLSHSDYKDLTFELALLADEKVEVKKEMIPNNYKSWSWYVGLGWNKGPLEGFSKEEDYSCCLVLDAAYQKNLSNRLSLKITYNYLGDSGSSDQYSTPNNTGTPNTSIYRAKESNAHLFSVALPIYFSKDDHFAWYLAPEYGTVTSKYKYLKYTYSNFGYATIDGYDYEARFTQKFTGVHYGAEWVDLTRPESAGIYFVLGGRKYAEPSKVEFDFFGDTGNRPKNANVVIYINLGWTKAY